VEGIGEEIDYDYCIEPLSQVTDGEPDGRTDEVPELANLNDGR